MDVRHAIPLINTLIAEADAVRAAPSRFDAWQRKCRTVLDRIFGENSSQSQDLMKVDYSPKGHYDDGDDEPTIQVFGQGLDAAEELLGTFIWELQSFGMPASNSASPIQPREAVTEVVSHDAKTGCPMDVLISWSKSQSRDIATVFRDWLPKVLPGLQPWMSSKDIDKGTQWFAELQIFLARASSCVICLTNENVRSPWMYYETGAIAAKREDVLVCPYLVGIDQNMIADGPLVQWQCTNATKDDTLALIHSLNKRLARPHDEGLLRGNFESRWPEFERELARVLAMETPSPADYVQTDADALAGNLLSSEARRLLLAAASANAQVLYTRTSSGCNTSVSGRILNEPRNRRSEATWEQAIKDLVASDLLTQRDNNGQVFEVTLKGYRVADVLQKRGNG